jgi:hypothetical protein
MDCWILTFRNLSQPTYAACGRRGAEVPQVMVVGRRQVMALLDFPAVPERVARIHRNFYQVMNTPDQERSPGVGDVGMCAANGIMEQCRRPAM